MHRENYRNKAEWHRLYCTKQWKSLRSHKLQQEPTCRYCREIGKHTAATVVDHIEPHKGDTYKFHDFGNLQSLCKRCHDGTKQAYEKSGRLRGSTKAGIPVDKDHHWNRETRTKGSE